MLRALFESQVGEAQSVLCSDAASNFLVLSQEANNVVDHWVVDDFLLALGHGMSFLLHHLSVEAIETHYQQSKPLKQVKVEVPSSANGVSLVRFSYRNKVLFQKTYDDAMEAAMMGDSYLAALSGWELTRAKATYATRAVVLLRRRNQTHEARLLQLVPDASQEPHGLVLEVYRGSERILARFGVFPRLIAQGNAFVPADRSVVYKQRADVIYQGTELEIQTQPFAPLALPSGGVAMFEYTLHQVKTAVLPLAHSSGFKIEVFVEGRFLGTVLRDMGRGNHPYPLARAIHDAQDLLKALQGWSL